MNGDRNAGSRGSTALAVIVLCAGALYFSTLNVHSYWSDEVRTALDMRMGLEEMVRSRAENGHPPVFFSVLWVVAQIAGDGEVALRTIPALVALACGPAVYAVFRPLVGSGPAVAAAAMLLFSPLFLSLGQVARNYTSVVLLTLLLVRWIIVAECDRGRGEEAEPWPRVVGFLR